MPAQAAMTIHTNRLMLASVVSIQRACGPAVALPTRWTSDAALREGLFRPRVNSAVVAVVVGPRVVGGRSVVVAGRIIAIARRIAGAGLLVVALRVAIARVVRVRTARECPGEGRSRDDATDISHGGVIELSKESTRVVLKGCVQFAAIR